MFFRDDEQTHLLEFALENMPDNINETVAPRKIFYRLSESEIFDYANKNTTINGMKLVDVLPKMVVSDQGFNHVSYNQLDKTVQYELFEGPHYKLSCKKTMKSYIESGDLQMVYSDTYKLPTCIPYLVQGSGKTARIFVNVSDFMSMDTYGKYQVQQARNYNGLMAILFAASVALTIVKLNYTAVPADLGDGMVLVYSSMIERVINSIVHMDPITREKIRYFSAEFALIQMYGTETGHNMFIERYVNFFPKLSKMMTDTMDAQFHLDSFDRLSSFILELKTLYPSMKNISDYIIMDKWIRIFGSATTLSIDYFGYHIYTICMVLFESPLISRMALEPVMEKNKGLEMYRRMQMMIGSQ